MTGACAGPASWKEDAVADALDKLDRPTVVTLNEIGRAGETRFQEWLNDRRSARQVPHRLEVAGYVRVRNPDAKDGLWRVAGRRQVIYGLHDLPTRDLIVAARQRLGR
jgi:hypothetical protein